MARRLFVVIVAALVMGVVFGGLRVADAVNSAAQLSRTQQLAALSEQLVALVNDLENERDETLLLSAVSASEEQARIAPWYARTTAEITVVQQLASAIGGLPGNIQADVNSVLADVSPSRVRELHAVAAGGDLVVIPAYSATIIAVITLADQAGQGVPDASLSGDVQVLNALAVAREQVSQQRALLNYAFTSPDLRSVTYLDAKGTKESVSGIATVDPGAEQLLAVAYDQQFADINAVYRAATPAQAAYFEYKTHKSAGAAAAQTAQDIEQSIFLHDDTDYVAGHTDTGALVPGSQLIPSLQGIPLQQGPAGSAVLQRGLATWDLGTGDELTAMQSTEAMIVGDIESRAGQLHQAAQRSALISGIVTVVALLVVVLAALAVARSLVLPLRRLRLGALDIASAQLPERVKLLTESPGDVVSIEVTPINVPSQDEIGQVARAFDQVHSEAVRLAGEQALLRASFNAMFVNLSRRSQTLIERLARMIDALEQNEYDPDRLGSLFAMDHLVTRMRRNSENLLLLAGHENPRKWSQSVPVADIALAAASEIEQYNRVALNIPPGVCVVGQAVSDMVHLFAELIENATVFSPKETQVQVSLQELSSGGVLLEIVDKGIGVSEERLAEMNSRLDNPPMIDVSVSRHMGLFAVACLAERHQVRIRLRPASSRGLSALIWLPESVIERTGSPGAVLAGRLARPAGARGRAAKPDASITSSADLAAGFASENGTTERRSTAGLPVRVPGASMPRQTATITVPGDQGGLPAPRSGRLPGKGHEAADGGQALPQRSPERARSRLAGFQRGTRRAAEQSGSGSEAPRPGEGTQR